MDIQVSKFKNVHCRQARFFLEKKNKFYVWCYFLNYSNEEEKHDSMHSVIGGKSGSSDQNDVLLSPPIVRHASAEHDDICVQQHLPDGGTHVPGTHESPSQREKEDVPLWARGAETNGCGQWPSGKCARLLHPSGLIFLLYLRLKQFWNKFGLETFYMYWKSPILGGVVLSGNNFKDHNQTSWNFCVCEKLFELKSDK